MKPITIAIDGPAGAGKSTVAKALAARLGYIYIDTGAMYRAMTYRLLTDGIDIDDAAAVRAAVADMRVQFQNQDSLTAVLINDEDVTDYLRTECVSASVSTVAAYAFVRARLVEEQRRMASGGGIVMDGRDIGTVVLPHAELKIFLTAPVEVRAQRRYEQMLQEIGKAPALSTVISALEKRDMTDRNRRTSPLKPAADAILLDNGAWSTEETVEKIVTLAKRVM